MLDQYVEWPTWIDPVLGAITLTIMGLFCYMSAHLVSERKAGKQIPMFWEKIGEKMGYGKGYSKKPAKKAKMAKKPAKKTKKTKKY